MDLNGTQIRLSSYLCTPFYLQTALRYLSYSSSTVTVYYRAASKILGSAIKKHIDKYMYTNVLKDFSYQNISAEQSRAVSRTFSSRQRFQNFHMVQTVHFIGQ